MSEASAVHRQALKAKPFSAAPQRRMRAVRIVIVVSTTVTAACAPPAALPAHNGDAAGAQFAELMRRPDLDQALADYERTRARMREELSAALGPLSWAQDPGTDSRGICRSGLWPATGFDLVDSDDAVTAHPVTWYAPVSLTPATSSAMTTIATRVGGEAGFTARVLYIDRPGNYQLTLTDDVGTALALGADRNLVLALKTGCHLTAKAHQRATARRSPAPSTMSAPR